MKKILKAFGGIAVGALGVCLLLATAMTVIVMGSASLGLYYGISNTSSTPDLILWFLSAMFIVIIASLISFKGLIYGLRFIWKQLSILGSMIRNKAKGVPDDGGSEENECDNEDEGKDSERKGKRKRKK